MKNSMTADTAIEIVAEAKKEILGYTGNKKCWFSLRKVFLRYGAYDIKLFWRKLAPYVLNEKSILTIYFEDFIQKTEHINEGIEIEKNDFMKVCAGDPLLYEKTFGYPPKVA
ncbi:MAG: hypothetical protein ACPGTS_01185 [Minisyncoccia bacterium]